MWRRDEPPRQFEETDLREHVMETEAMSHPRTCQRWEEEVLGDESATRLENLRIEVAQARLIQSEKMASLGKLVAGLAHEINTPIGVMNSTNDMVERVLARLAAERKDDPAFVASLDTLREMRAHADEASRRLGTIVARLKSFTGLDEADFRRADVRDGIEATLALLTPQWGDRISVIKELDDVPAIDSYPTELNQALMTLLLNAGESIDDEGTITVRTSHDNGHVRMVISDTGRGIPRDRLDTLFDVGLTQKGSRMRLQVGLANVRATVDKHHGEIHVESEPGKGTTFEIRLPIEGARA